MSNNFLIVCAEDEIIYKGFESFIKIGVERGNLDLINNHQKIDYSISDFDQVNREEFELISKNVSQSNLFILDKNKDFLDGECAIKKSLELAANNIIMVVKPSYRSDMNLSLIWLIKKYNVKIINKKSYIFKIEKGNFIFNFEQFQDYKYVSFYPIYNCTISLKNFKFNVANLKLEASEIRAYSNQFVYGDKNAEIDTDTDILCILTK